MAEMTPQEAIEILQHERDWAQQPFYVDAALSIAIEALEKNFPEQDKTLTLVFGKDGKARVLNEDYVIYCADEETFEKVKAAVENYTSKKPFHRFPISSCPKCNRVVYPQMKYCSDCGQKFDWSNTK